MTSHKRVKVWGRQQTPTVHPF